MSPRATLPLPSTLIYHSARLYRRVRENRWQDARLIYYTIVRSMQLVPPWQTVLDPAGAARFIWQASAD